MLKRSLSFDYWPTGALTAAQRGAYGFYNDSPTGVVPGRFGYGKCITLPGGGTNDWTTWVITEDGETFNEGYLGVALKTTGTAGIGFIAGAFGEQCYVTFDSEIGVVKAYRGDVGSTALLAYSAAGIIPQNVWMYVEVHCKIGDGTGVIEVRINTETVLALPAVDNQNFVGCDFYDSIRFWQGGTDQAYWDDCYFNDPTGSVNNGYLGNVRVQGMLPTGVGNQTEWTSYNGVMPNWQAATNIAISDAQYVYNPIADVGDYDLYDLPALVNTPNVYGVTVLGAYRQDDATQMFVQNALRTNGVDHFGALYATFQDYHVFYDVYETNPETGVGWTYADVNSLQIGPKQQD